MTERWQIRPLGAWTDPETAFPKSSGVFQAAWDDTLALLRDEVDRLDGEYPVIIQVDVTELDLRRDGMLRSGARVGHRGAVVSFGSRHGPLRYATDAYEQRYSGAPPGWQANVRAIALALAALRAVDRYGVTKRGEQYAGWRAITRTSGYFADAAEARAFLERLWIEDTGGTIDAAPDEARLYRALARRHHPDSTGGAREIWDRLEAAAQLLGLTSGAPRTAAAGG